MGISYVFEMMVLKYGDGEAGEHLTSLHKTELLFMCKVLTE